MLSRLQNISGSQQAHLQTKPRTQAYQHIKVNLKKQQMRDDKTTEIERENRILLEKMKRIYLKD